MFAYLITIYHINGSLNSMVNFYSLSIRWQNVLNTVWSSLAAKSTKNSLSVHFLTYKQQAVMPILVIKPANLCSKHWRISSEKPFSTILLSCFHLMKQTSSPRWVALACCAFPPHFFPAVLPRETNKVMEVDEPLFSCSFLFKLEGFKLAFLRYSFK